MNPYRCTEYAWSRSRSSPFDTSAAENWIHGTDYSVKYEKSVALLLMILYWNHFPAALSYEWLQGKSRVSGNDGIRAESFKRGTSLTYLGVVQERKFNIPTTRDDHIVIWTVLLFQVKWLFGRYGWPPCSSGRAAQYVVNDFFDILRARCLNAKELIFIYSFDWSALLVRTA